ncbi:metallophosphoesterase [Rhodoblastus sp.]|uniref:metallophosphoesterase n=1 Tax=Rhodoblastus sp. TaxID=1962975 RepID=UPI0026134E9A|nr:metallophosphoesterase [Rhodoblastus sp.]
MEPITAKAADILGFLQPDEVVRALDGRLGRVHARQRLGIEDEHETQAFGQGLTFVHLENIPLSRAILHVLLRISGIYWRGVENARKIELRRNVISSSRIDPAFDGFAILHLSDLHADMSARAMRRVAEIASGLSYDLCVLTGDYRGETFGPYVSCVRELGELRDALKGDIFAVLGNHDSIRMVPDLERMGVKFLLNENVALARGDARIYLAGVDDAHFYRVDNIEKATTGIPDDGYSILLSHTPEIYRQAAHAGFDLMLSGHTHGGQICLPGGIPVTLESNLPRRMGRGPWRYGEMAGYTSAGAGSCIVPVRFNCPPEMTLHVLRTSA